MGVSPPPRDICDAYRRPRRWRLRSRRIAASLFLFRWALGFS